MQQPEKSIISAAHHLKHPHETKGLRKCLVAKGHLSLKSGAESKKKKKHVVEITAFGEL